MHHDENNSRHSDQRDMRHRREQHPDQRREGHFNDFQSRWGEPTPPLNLHRNDRQSRDIGSFEREGQFHQSQEEWLPNQQRQHSPRQEHRQGDTSWRQRDVNFDRDNQRAENRWEDNRTLPHPDDTRRRRREPRDDYGYDDRDHRDRR